MQPCRNKKSGMTVLSHAPTPALHPLQIFIVIILYHFKVCNKGTSKIHLLYVILPIAVFPFFCAYTVGVLCEYCRKNGRASPIRRKRPCRFSNDIRSFCSCSARFAHGDQRVGNRAVDTHLKMQMGFILHFHRDLPDLADHIAHFDAAALFHSRFLL